MYSSRKQAEDPIDSVNFDVDAYVKNVLSCSSVKDLVAKDIRMVQEIKAIDSDLQMLVYENYAKFISATDTIKRMKVNVEAMDVDMSTVLGRMKTISSSSTVLDSKLEASRNKVDKLVRVKRLLERLQFLTHLPESLAKMIHNEEYKEAVKLYNKTISILKNHSDILSFKNIQERTELMMRDLRSRVMHFLDMRELDCTKLTYYVSILHLMDAPRLEVSQKLTNAHAQRSATLNNEFETYLSLANDSGSKGVNISVLMKYHQNVLVGLIESSKGLRELFGGGDQILEAEEPFHQLVAMIRDVLKVYTSLTSTAIKSFFDGYDHNLGLALGVTGDADASKRGVFEVREEKDTVPEGKNPFEAEELEEEERTRDAQLRSYAQDEERQRWLTFIRQAILDWQYLDTALKECIPALFQTATEEESKLATEGLTVEKVKAMQAKAEASCALSSSYSASVIAILESHRGRTFNLYIDQLVAHFSLTSIELAELCSVHRHIDERHSDVTLRSLMSKHCVESKRKVDLLIEAFFHTFADICASAKLMQDVLAVTKEAGSNRDSIVEDFLESVQLRFEALNHLSPNTIDYIAFREIYTEKHFDGPMEEGQEVVEYSAVTPLSTALTRNLVSASLFKKISTQLVRRMSVCLIEQDMAGEFNGDGQLHNRCTRLVSDLSHRCLVLFVETRSHAISYSLQNALLTGLATASKEDSNRTFFTVSPALVHVVEDFDRLSVACCVLLGETPPPHKAFTVERDLYKRNVNRKGQGKRGGVQLDIDRLFSTKIEVFEVDQITLSSEAVLRVVSKAMLKTCVETTREIVGLSVHAHIQVQADILFLKQAVAALLSSESLGEVEELADFALNSAALRCLQPDDVPEGLSLLKIVSDALAAISNQPSLFQR